MALHSKCHDGSNFDNDDDDNNDDDDDDDDDDDNDDVIDIRQSAGKYFFH